jgi:hypothetical protein
VLVLVRLLGAPPTGGTHLESNVEHTLLDFGEVELATNLFQLIIKPLPIRERWRAFIDGQLGE